MPVRHAVRDDSAMQTRARTWWLYLLACKNGRMYAGIALDVSARFALHASGKGAKFTRANPPKKILAAQPFPTRSEALKAEYALKQLDRAAKLRWLQQWRFEAASALSAEHAGEGEPASLAHHFKSSGTTKSL